MAIMKRLSYAISQAVVLVVSAAIFMGLTVVVLAMMSLMGVGELKFLLRL